MPRYILGARGMGLDLYYCSLLNDVQPLLEPARAVLDASELARYHGYRPQKQIEFSLGRLLVKRALAARLSRPIGDIRFSYSHLGKPLLPGARCSFNISHCKSAVVAVVSDVPAGVDVEQIYRGGGGSADRSQPWQRAASFLNLPMAQMLDRLASDDEHSRARLFTQLWTCLEARVKMSGNSVFDLRKTFQLIIHDRYYQPACQASRGCYFASWQLQNNEIVSLASAAPAPIKIWQYKRERLQQLIVEPIACSLPLGSY